MHSYVISTATVQPQAGVHELKKTTSPSSLEKKMNPLKLLCRRPAMRNASMLPPHLVLHADAGRVDHEVTPVPLKDPLLLARQVAQLLAAALHVVVERGQVSAPLLGLVLQEDR